MLLFVANIIQVALAWYFLLFVNWLVWILIIVLFYFQFQVSSKSGLITNAIYHFLDALDNSESELKFNLINARYFIVLVKVYFLIFHFHLSNLYFLFAKYLFVAIFILIFYKKKARKITFISISLFDWLFFNCSFF